MKNLVLLNETDICDYDILHEDAVGMGQKQICVRGPYFMYDKKNINNRIYPRRILESQIQDFVENKVKKNLATACGELEHSQETFVDSRKAAHRIVELVEDSASNCWIGKSIILTGTPNGDILAALLRHKTRMGMSSRGVGKLNEANSGVVDFYKLVTVDAVSEPSINKHLDAINESKQYMIDSHGIIVEMAYHSFDKKLEHLTSKDTEPLAAAVREFMQSINKKG